MEHSTKIKDILVKISYNSAPKFLLFTREPIQFQQKKFCKHWSSRSPHHTSSYRNATPGRRKPSPTLSGPRVKTRACPGTRSTGRPDHIASPLPRRQRSSTKASREQ